MILKTLNIILWITIVGLLLFYFIQVPKNIHYVLVKECNNTITDELIMTKEQYTNTKEQATFQQYRFNQMVNIT